MKLTLQGALTVIGKPTQQAKKDNTVTYYYVTASQGEDEAGKIRVADIDVYNRIEKYKSQLFTFTYDDKYGSFVISDVTPLEPSEQKTPDKAPDKAPDKSATATADNRK